MKGVWSKRTRVLLRLIKKHKVIENTELYEGLLPNLEGRGLSMREFEASVSKLRIWVGHLEDIVENSTQEDAELCDFKVTPNPEANYPKFIRLASRVDN